MDLGEVKQGGEQICAVASEDLAVRPWFNRLLAMCLHMVI